MSRLKVYNAPEDKRDDSSDSFYSSLAFSAFGTEIEVDGHKLTGVRSLDLRVHIDEVVKATIEVLPTDEFVVETDATVAFRFIPSAEFAIEATPLPNGGTRLQCVRIPVAVKA